ncbi:MAG: hypothetical protein WCY09_04030 [Candidatus Omnitrophota bacterium]
MCCIFLFTALKAIVPIAILLTISFFVLLSMRKVEEKGLRAFGYVAVSFLWLAILVVFSGAIYKTAAGPFGERRTAQQKMRNCDMPQMMQQNRMPNMVMPDKGMSVKDERNFKAPKCGGNKGMVFKAE